jgi:threonine/homoserine/homoserine lactone efflux protein
VEGEGRSSLARVFGRGVVVSLLNPKVALSFLAFLPQFVNSERDSVALQCLVLGAIFNTTGFGVNAAVGLLGGKVGAFMRRHPKAATYQEKTTGAICIALGLRLAVANRR